MSERVEHFSYMTRLYQTRAENCYPTHPITKAAEGVPLEVGTDASGKKSRIMGLPDCQNSFKIGLTVLTVTQQRRVTDRHVHRCTYTLRVCLTSVCRVHCAKVENREA